MENNNHFNEDFDNEEFEFLNNMSRRRNQCKLDMGSLKSDNPLKVYEFLRITDTTDIPKPTPIITINDEIISSEANITTISGASKSGKSAFASILMAGAISKNGNIDGLEGVIVEPFR